MKNVIVLDIYAGIGNRFQGLSALSRVYKDLGCRCIILWRVENSCNIRYEKLLKKKDHIRVINLYDTGLRKNPVRTIIGRLLVKIIKHRADRCYTLNEMHELTREKGYEGVLEILRSNKLNYIFSRSSFVPFTTDDLELVDCSPGVEKRGRDLWKKIEEGGNVIGIHVRRTDNVVSIKNSPDELFYKRMDSELAKDDSVRFFLCTDDESVERNMIKRYGEDRFILYKKVNNRSSKEGLQDALVEMMGLSKCRMIVGSKGSTFSYFANKIGKNEYVVD
ncbi:MAG: hypothetical protein K5886_08490 [Lachnospiraceae bacterium]|nr:hypothetical protein [Lachnospiraceae bacterium]